MMDYSRQTRIVKLSGLPEVLLRGDGSTRVIDATTKPINSVAARQRAHATPAAPAGHPNFRLHSSSSLSPTITSQQSFKPQTRSSFQSNLNSIPTQPNIAPRRKNSSIEQRSNLNYFSIKRDQAQQSQHQNIPSRSCTPNILHRANKFTSPPKQAQPRRAVSSSPTDKHSLLVECMQTLKQLYLQFESFIENEQERSTLSNTSKPTTAPERHSPVLTPSHHTVPPVAQTFAHQTHPCSQNQARQQHYHQPSVIHEEEHYIFGQQQRQPHSSVVPRTHLRRSSTDHCHDHCSCHNCLGCHTKTYPHCSSNQPTSVPSTTSNYIDLNDDGPANLSMASREYLSRHNLV